MKRVAKWTNRDRACKLRWFTSHQTSLQVSPFPFIKVLCSRIFFSIFFCFLGCRFLGRRSSFSRSSFLYTLRWVVIARTFPCLWLRKVSPGEGHDVWQSKGLKSALSRVTPPSNPEITPVIWANGVQFLCPSLFLAEKTHSSKHQFPLCVYSRKWPVKAMIRNILAIA